MAEVDFGDREAAKKWFEGRSAEERSVMSSRAALRVAANLGRYDGRGAERLVLTALRCTLTSAMRGLGRTADVSWLRDAAYSAAGSTNSAAGLAVGSTNSTPGPAAFSAFSASDSALSAIDSDFSVALAAIHNAARSAHSAYPATHSAAFSATQWDSERIEGDLNAERLWAGAEVPPEIQSAHDAFLTQLRANSDWDFFRSWYEQMWEGTFTDWDLATEVAKIDKDVWEAGLAEVAKAIRGIEARLLVERLPQVEEVFETDDGLYDVRGTISETCRLIESVVNRVQFALNTALESNVCDLNEMSMAAKLLRHALENCLDDPNALEQYLRQASALVKSRLDSGYYGTDEALDHLTRTLDETALQLRADHPDVAAAADARLQQRLREIDDAKRLIGAALIEDIQEGTTARLNAEMGLAVETLRDGSSVEASAEALKQNANRASKISLTERAKKAESSGAMASLKMGLRAHKLVDFVMGLISSGPM